MSNIPAIVKASYPSTEEIIELAKQLEQYINFLTHLHVDHAGRIDEAMTSIANVIDNMESHKKDIEAGIE